MPARRSTFMCARKGKTMPHPRYRAAAVSIASAILACAACSQPRLESSTQKGQGKVAAESIPPPSKGETLAATDLYHLRSVGDVHVAPDGSRIAYSVVN